MTATEDPGARDPVDVLAEEFLQRHRRGEGPAVEDFAAAHPEHADSLRQLLPMLLALEQVKRERTSSSGRRLGRHALPPLERLGDFRIVREIGRGGMGVVFEAVQESLGRRVALKVLPQASLLSGNQLQRFQREARIAAQLHHTNIVPVFGSGHSDGFHWYAMQFIAGESLVEWLVRAAAEPTHGADTRARCRDVARIGAQAAAALHYAHGQGTLHRDIKPGNLLLERDGHVWVTDFGLAKALEADGLTHSGDLLGTLQYMAPEQFAGRYDVRSEVYALGVTLYELLTLRPAFAAKTRSELMEAIRTQSPRPLRKTAPDVPEDLAIVVERAIAREPGDRYPDAQAFADDLVAFLEDRPIAARRHNTLKVLWRWCRRNRAMATLAACTLLAVLGAAVTGWTAYVVTDDALERAREATAVAQQKSRLVESNLALTLDAFGDVFDALVGRDPALAFEADPDTGEQAVVERTVVPRDVALLQQMLAFYDRFAAENEGNQALRLETARAHRRVGSIQARLGNLDEAAAGYDKALECFRTITQRDVTRELADVHVAYAKLEQRRRRQPEAEQRLRLALELLGPDDPGNNATLRFRRAEAHFLLASTLLFGLEPGRRPLERPRDLDRTRTEGRRELATARQILESLLAAEPDEPDLLALRARCMLVAARPRSGGPGGADRDAERAADRAGAVEIFRRLVKEHPEVDQYAFELCTALLDDRRAGGGAASRTLEDAMLANDLAVGLLARQPDFPEYQALRVKTAATLGRMLVRGAGDDAGSAERRARAETELRAAVDGLRALAARSETVDLIVTLDGLSARATLAGLFADSGRAAEARAEAAAVVAELTSLADRRRRGRSPPLPTRLVDDLATILRRVDAPEAAQKLAELRAKLQLPPDERPDRAPPGPPRRR